MKVGFLGLGIMGRPMAKNLVKAGYEVVVTTHKQAVIDEFVAMGAAGAKNAADIVKQGCEVIITMLPNSENIVISLHTYKLTKAATTKANGKLTRTCSCSSAAATKTVYKAAEFELSKTKYSYTGGAKKPKVTVYDYNGKKLTENVDFKVKYAVGRRNVGKYKVTVTLMGNYSGTKTKYFTIAPKKTSVSKVTAAKKALTVQIKKQTKNTSGYEIQYSTSSKFKSGNKTVDVKKNSTTSVKIKKLKAKKNYYVRVRTYKKINGKKHCSEWSKAVKKKTK